MSMLSEEIRFQSTVSPKDRFELVGKNGEILCSGNGIEDFKTKVNELGLMSLDISATIGRPNTKTTTFYTDLYRR